MLLVVVEDLFHRLNTRVFIALVVLSGGFLVPIKDLQQGLATCPNTIRRGLTRPTKGEIRVTPASAQATAWPKPKRSVRLQ
jgi:hypothetical protein